jgi:ribosomal protein S6--L-glutamate ligase
MGNRFLTSPLKVGVVVEPRYLEQRQPAGLCAELRRRGHEAVVIDPDAVCRVGSGDWLSGIDVIVPRGRSLTLLGLVELAERRGLPVVNGRSAIASVHNKLDMAVALVAAGIPTPPTFAASLERLAHAVPAGAYPLVLKPTFGDNGRGLMIAHDAEELARLSWPEPFALAQQLVPSDGFDLKLYGIGDDVWAIRSPSPLTSPTAGERRPAPLTPELVALARRCGELFGLELYGVDCVETTDGPLVIEVNDFPNYTAVDEADERLVAHVERCAAR